jgi:hypothetical protein
LKLFSERTLKVFSDSPQIRPIKNQTTIIMLRTSLARQARTFSTRSPLFKTPVEVGKDALKKVDRVVADAAIKGLDAGGKFRSFSCNQFTQGRRIRA